MATDDERRRVALTLRRLVESDLPPWVGYTYEAVMGYMPRVGEGSAYHESSYREYCLRLADLIDPDASEAETGCIDLKMLLTMADSLDRSLGWCEPDKDGCVRVKVSRLRDVARRIREACGEAANGVPTGRRGPGRREETWPQAGGPSGRPCAGAREEKN